MLFAHKYELSHLLHDHRHLPVFYICIWRLLPFFYHLRKSKNNVNNMLSFRRIFEYIKIFTSIATIVMQITKRKLILFIVNVLRIVATLFYNFLLWNNQFIPISHLRINWATRESIFTQMKFWKKRDVIYNNYLPTIAKTKKTKIFDPVHYYLSYEI